MSSDLVDIPRSLAIKLPKGQSAFLWGPRKLGKTTLLKRAFPQTVFYDLLETDTHMRLSKEPFRLREELSALPPSHFKRGPIIIDEIQKIPALLDEIHWLIENKKLSFVLCGSSARKLKRAHANMLGGRAWRFELFPLTWKELGDRFDLMRALKQGLVPAHYLSDHPDRDLKAYIFDYLKEEIQYEGLVRNLPAFSRFLDAVSFSQGELVNYSNISRDCGVDSKTVAGYYQILVDTLVGYLLEPFRKRRNRQIILETPKFYLFDVGISGFLTKRSLTVDKGPEFGRAFEHFLLMEILAYRSYAELDVSLAFWRTKGGVEVDFVLDDGSVAIEVKGTSRVDNQDLKGLKIFREEYKPRKAILVCQESRSRKLESGIAILPWQAFLEQLWSGEIF